MTTAYVAPATLEEAVALLAEQPAARPVAGGTDLVVAVRQGRRTLPPALVSLHRVEELRGITVHGETLVIGALATHGDLERSPLVRECWTALADAAALVGSPATRATGTVAGNLANGSPAMELGSPLLVLGASVELRSAAGGRLLAVEELLTGPGATALAPGELIAAVRVPPPAPGSGSAYVRLDYRRSMEIAVVGAAARLDLGGGVIADAALALTAVAPTCVRAPAAEAALRGRAPDDAALEQAAALAAAAARPIDDVRAPAEYRAALVPEIARRALALARERAAAGEA